jgi:creatinine amidohydrolase
MNSGSSRPLRSYAVTDLPWTAVAAHLERDRRLILAVGACDQHGPHLPLGAGTCVAESLATDLSQEFGVLRAPPFTYGVNLPSESDYAGTATLKAKTLHRALNELLASWAAHGFDEFIAITAQLHEPHAEAIATVSAAHARVRVVEALSVDLSRFVEGDPGPQHGGEILTSLLLHLRPGAVNMAEAKDYTMDPEKMRKFVRGRLHTLPEGCPGSIGQPTKASAERGREMYEHILQKIRHKVFIAPRDPGNVA